MLINHSFSGEKLLDEYYPGSTPGEAIISKYLAKIRKGHMSRQI